MFRKPALIPADQAPLRGVNLGAWLVLEKWITPALFAGTDAVDEYTLCEKGGKLVLDRLRKFRDTFITEADFAWLKEHGVGAVRLPVGYWNYGGEAPFLATDTYVARTFKWAAKYDIKVLLDLHGAPGSQNGWDHSGRAGELNWPTDTANIATSLQVITRLAEDYGKHPQLLGIELLNEPKWTIPRKVLLNYNETAYRIIREHCGPEPWVVFHDNFRPRRWRKALRGEPYQNVYIDTHQYQCFSKRDRRRTIPKILKRTTTVLPRRLAKMMRFHPVIVGEWSLALDKGTTGPLSKDQLGSVSQAYGGAQLLAYSHAKAWFYWTYKTEHSATWSYRTAVEKGWLPGGKP